MCTSVVEVAAIEGSGKGHEGWFPLSQAVVSWDHPTHAMLEESINIDFLNDALGPGARVAVEMTAESGRALAHAILTALDGANAWGYFSELSAVGERPRTPLAKG